MSRKMKGGGNMEATGAITADVSMQSVLKEFILKELDLGYDKRQNVLMSCTIDGCNRISYCSCDCNDNAW
jgi:hypothetical protein